ncbi:hypothetical protein D3C73_1481340 [compost metagenome]
MLTEDLGLFIAFEASGPGIPAGNDAVGINHVDRIVDNRIDQQAKTPVLNDAGLGSIFVHQTLTPEWFC